MAKLNGLTIGPLAFGCWRFAGAEPAAASALIEAALDSGLALVDTADIYGHEIAFGAAESLLGEVLRRAPSLRARMALATKGGIVPGAPYDSSRDYLVSACEASLRRLGVERIDLYQIHRPDLLTGMEDLARTLDELVASGKVERIGVSNFTVSELRALAAHMKSPIFSVQNEFSALCQTPIDDGVLNWTEETGAVFLAWSPLAGGRIVDPGDARERAVCGALDQAAAELETDRTGAALAFLLTHPAHVVPILGTQRAERVRALARTAPLRLTRRRWYDIVEARRGRPMP